MENGASIDKENLIKFHHLFSQMKNSLASINSRGREKSDMTKASVIKNLIDCVYKCLLVIKILCTEGLRIICDDEQKEKKNIGLKSLLEGKTNTWDRKKT